MQQEARSDTLNFTRDDVLDFLSQVVQSVGLSHDFWVHRERGKWRRSGHDFWNHKGKLVEHRLELGDSLL